MSKHVKSLTQLQAVIFDTDLYSLPSLVNVLPPQFSLFNRDLAIQKMREWVRGKYTPIVEFAFLDNESETGYAWPDKDLGDKLQDMFGDQYPFELIEEVAQDLEMNEGALGIEDYGPDDDDANQGMSPTSPSA